MATYTEKLKDPRWQRKRLEVLQRDEFKCCLCGDEKTQLHVHHAYYKGEPWEVPLECLKTLCRDCHATVESDKELGQNFQNILRVIKHGFAVVVFFKYLDKLVLGLYANNAGDIVNSMYVSEDTLKTITTEFTSILNGKE